MKSIIFFILLFLSIQNTFTQIDSTQIDTKYLEDQFYIGISYNLLTNKPSKVNQYNLSRSMYGGFIRDIPMNKQRNIGIGIGIGYSYNLIYTNIKATSTSSKILYDIVSMNDNNIEKNYYQWHSMDFIPMEFRWRTSTAYYHKFWRIYTGIKASYLFGSSYRMKNDTEQLFYKSPDTQKYFEWKIYTSVGHNTWNLFVQYSLRPLFKDQTTQSGVPIDMNVLNIGLIFYIL
ncbi:PorT family protein [Capnocytophaga catalasegens]|uniref:Outer membrane protein beta-barrel domain-containing protein n=1 Tax=Capnocytophaga catalasegens TaxID=1004260 RepID=A0AAV5AZ88_9FLAO|nr:PorT family protein [Capnocytophaga catalasegens]GIZ15450.1 hypothetical protein RCZ03_14500 [Capnocytophaga catalasegens]GJM51038.1 hypothetical protein RCZ15_20110 [Capnocytophaga catalasegens]GJM52223.1 hypothetical protein RCZ16_05410 [Capnocytophaga catalasegens]